MNDDLFLYEEATVDELRIILSRLDFLAGPMLNVFEQWTRGRATWKREDSERWLAYHA